MSDHLPDWLPEACAQLIATAIQPAASGSRVRAAQDLGARAALAGVALEDLVAALLDTAARAWSDLPRSVLGSTPVDVQRQAARLLSAVSSLTSTALDEYHKAARGELSQRDADRAEFVSELLGGHGDPGRLAARAQRYGIRLSGRHTVTVARSEALSDAVAHAVDDALTGRFGAGNTLITLRRNELVCISAGGLRGVPAELAHYLLNLLPAGSWQIGVGRTHPGLSGLASSLEEARNTLDLGDRLGFTAPVLHASDLLVFPVLLRDRDAITDLVTTVLGPLTEARGGPRLYLETLTVLFEHQGNQTATARALHISVRAVTYRLDRIRALTGYHPSEPTQRFTLHTAVLGAKLLGWPEGSG